LKNIRSARHEYFKQIDARNFLHGFIHEKLQEKNHVNIFLFEVMKILNACKIQVIAKQPPEHIFADF